MGLQTLCLVVVVIFTMMPLFDCWKNSFDSNLHYTCPSPNQHISHFVSQHSNRHEDRVFDFDCRTASNKPVKCYWTDWLNNMDQPFVYQCHNGGYINGIQSHHSNRHEDRTFKFRCCSPNGQSASFCKFHGWVNSYDKAVNFFVPTGHVLTGVASIHDNGPEDRIFQFQTCRLMDMCGGN